MSPVTSNTAVGVFKNADDARRAVRALREAGFAQDSISFVIRTDGPENMPETVPASRVATDAEIGAAAGGIGGVLLGLASVAVPGVGAVVAMGPLLAALGGAGIGAVTGGMIGALTDVGLTKEEAHYYAEGVERGDAIVTVRAGDPDAADRALRIMDANGAIDLDAKIAGWRERGWVGQESGETAGHDPGAERFSEDEVRRGHEPRDIGEDLVKVAAPEDAPRRRNT